MSETFGQAPVYIDARMSGHAGIGRYLKELVGALQRRPAAPPYILLEDAKAGSLAATGSRTLRVGSGIYSLAEQWEIPRRILRDAPAAVDPKNALLHVPHFNVPVLFSGKLVATIHDLTYIHSPEASRSRWAGAYSRFLIRHITKKAAAVITVSEYTKKDLLSLFPHMAPQRVRVIHEGVSERFRVIGDPESLLEARQRHGLHKPFVLFVGSLKPHKNLGLLLDAVEQLKKEALGAEWELVLVGRSDPSSKPLLDRITGLSYVRYLGERSDEELVRIYNLAECFVIPSLREGFGLPVLEAMACGVPVVSSDATSLPEVGGEAALYFKPTQVDALSQLLYNVLKNNDLRQNLKSKGLEWVKKFSWEETARMTEAVYRSVLQGQKPLA